MDIKVYLEPEVTLISKTEVTDAGREVMREFYSEQDALQPRDDNPGAVELIEFAGRVCYDANGRKSEKTSTGEGYLGNIMDQNHLSVFEHWSCTFDVRGISRAVSHEIVRHRHGSYSQESQRFVLSTKKPAVVVPPATIDLAIKIVEEQGGTKEEALKRLVESAQEVYEEDFVMYREDYQDYRDMGLGHKQASEAARYNIPNAASTRIEMTGNVRYWMEFIEKRDADGADAEIRRLAQKIQEILAEELPEVFSDEARKRWNNNSEQKGTK